MNKQPSSTHYLIPLVCLGAAILLLCLKGRLPLQPANCPVSKKVPPQENALVIYYHERPPYYVTGPLGVYGICVDPIKKACRLAGIRFHWERLPANRQLAEIRANRRRIGALGWFKTPERLRFAKFSRPIYRDQPLVALGRSANPRLPDHTRLGELLTNQHLILLRKNGYSYGPQIDAAIATCAPRQIYTNSNNLSMLEMIYTSRADYFFISPEEAENLTSTSGLLKSDFKIIHIRGLTAGNQRYIMFSRKVEDELLDKLNTALATGTATLPENDGKAL